MFPEDADIITGMYPETARQVAQVTALRMARESGQQPMPTGEQPQPQPQMPPAPMPQPQAPPPGGMPMPQPQAPAPGGLPMATGRQAPADLYAQADAKRKEAFGLRPDPQVTAQAMRQAQDNAFAGMVMQTLGGSRFKQAGGQVLTQALGRQSELETDPQKEFALKQRALEAEATALERQAALAQTAEDRRQLMEDAARIRAEAAREARADRAALAYGLAEVKKGAKSTADEQRAENELFKRTHTLRADYEKVAKDVNDQAQAARQLQTLSAKDPRTMTAQDQQAMIFSFMKMLDPGSVVRESEYAAAARARGVFDTAANYLTQLQTGKMLTPTQVRNMGIIAQEMLAASEAARKGFDDQFTRNAQRWGVDPGEFIRGTTVPKPGGGAPGGRPRFERRGQTPTGADGTTQLPY